MENSSFLPPNDDFISADNQPIDNLCGLGKCKPKILQRFADAKCFLIFFCLIGILQGAYFTYFIGILTTLEKRYSFDSWVTGVILIADNISPALFGVFVGYYGKFVHRPRFVTFGMMITVFSCFLSALPYFLFGSDIHFSHDSLKQRVELCESNEKSKSEDCLKLSQNTIAITILFIANFLNGFGSMAYYTMGTPYLDDNVKKKNSPLYLGATFALRVFGPTVGFMLSSFCLKYFEDPLVDPGFDNNDPKWVGAWWIGFIILGIAIFVVSFPIAFFPSKLAKDATSSESNVLSVKSVCSDLPISLKKLLMNPVLLFHTLSITFQINGLFGYFVYMPKYIESQYQKSASSANFFSGTVTLIAIVSGVFLGGYCIKKFKPRPRFLVGYMLFIEIFAGVVLLSAFFMGCESNQVQKKHNSVSFFEQQECSFNCSCNEEVFNPICDINGIIHFSPCFAGCHSYNLNKDNKKSYQDCSCITSINEEITEFQAKDGFCSADCSNFLPYILIISLTKMFSSTARVGNVLITLRCVDEEDKTLALGAVEFVISIFATIPYPLIYGYVIDKACILWSRTCEQDGNCWLYDTDLLRYYLHTLSLSFIFLAVCCDFVVFLMSPRMKDLYVSNKKRHENVEHQDTSL